jgi:hypothetical protein
LINIITPRYSRSKLVSSKPEHKNQALETLEKSNSPEQSEESRLAELNMEIECPRIHQTIEISHSTMKQEKLDDILKRLENLPDSWKPMVDNMQMNMKLERDDVGWLTNRISEDVDRGLITADINIRKSSSSCELDIIIRTLADIANNTAVQTAIGAALTLLIKEIREGLIWRYKKKLNNPEIAGVG